MLLLRFFLSILIILGIKYGNFLFKSSEMIDDNFLFLDVLLQNLKENESFFCCFF